MQCPNKLLRSLLLRMKDYYILRIFIIHHLEYWIVFDRVYELFYTSSNLFWLGFRIQLGASICGNYFCKSGANLKINLVKISQKLIFAIINYLFSHCIHFFISIKFISKYRLKFRLDIFNISDTKRSEQYFHISKEQACSK